MPNTRLAWEQAVTHGLAARGISITNLPEGAMASAFIEGATPESFIEWATPTGSATANAAAPNDADNTAPPRRPVFAPVTPTAYPTAQPMPQPMPQAASGKPVKPSATFVTVGAALYFLGSGLAGIGESVGVLFGGEAYLMLGGILGITGVVFALIGVHRFLTAHDRRLPVTPQVG